MAPSAPEISYAQHWEDTRLLRALGEQPSGFYIDVGAGHPVYDNVSFAFYLRGWRGITVEPNPWLGELSAAVRPRDTRVQSLLGEQPGEATYYLVEDFHGLSTTVEGHARRAHIEFGKPSRSMTMPIITLAALCEREAPPAIDFLKIDVEGAERHVLAGNDWTRFRPRIVMLEAIEPVTMKPAWDAWEPLLLGNGYRLVCFDGLNRSYVAEEHAALAAALAADPAPFDGIVKFSSFKPAHSDRSHPDHALARLLGDADMVRLPLMPSVAIAERLLVHLGPADSQRRMEPADIGAVHQLLFAQPAATMWGASLRLPANASIGDLYRGAVETEAFRAACGRISASTAW